VNSTYFEQIFCASPSTHKLKERISKRSEAVLKRAYAVEADHDRRRLRFRDLRQWYCRSRFADTKRGVLDNGIDLKSIRDGGKLAAENDSYVHHDKAGSKDGPGIVSGSNTYKTKITIDGILGLLMYEALLKDAAGINKPAVAEEGASSIGVLINIRETRCTSSCGTYAHVVPKSTRRPVIVQQKKLEGA
jgi:hypothetical protein